jgi:hypothetical protein
MPAGERYFSRRTFAFRIPPISQRYPPLINSDTRAWPFSFLLHANARASTCEDSACQLFQYLEYALPNGPHPSSLPPLLSPSLPRFSYRFFPIGLSGCVDQKTLNSEFVRWPARLPQPPPPASPVSRAEEANQFAIRPVLSSPLPSRCRPWEAVF